MPWRSVDLAVGLLFLFVRRGVVHWLQGEGRELPAGLLFLVGTVIPMFTVGLFPVWAYRRSCGRWPANRPSVADVARELAVAIPVLFVLFAAISALSLVWQQGFGEAPRMDPRMEDVAFSGQPWLLAIMAIGACLWAPVAEELFFRGFLQNALSQRMPVAAATVLQIVIFALVHPYSGIHLVAVGVIGAGLTLHYLWRRTLVASMLLHGLFNGLMLLLVGAMMLAASRSGTLGVRLDVESPACRVTGVYQGSGADEAGLTGGDVITAVNGESVESVSELRMRLLGHPPGEKIQLTVLRNDQLRDVPLTLSPRPGLTTVIREAADGD